MTVKASHGIAVFGGGAGWGKRIADSLLALGEVVLVIEKNDLPEVAKHALNDCHAIIIAIPDADIDALLATHSGHFARASILIECATNKSGFSERLRALADSGVSVCSTHPMAASTGALRGQNVLIMPMGDNAAPATALAEKLYCALGMNLSRFDFNQHGDAMIILQMVPHLVQRIMIDALASGAAKKSLSIDDFEQLASANYLLSELGLGRVAAQRADVSAGILQTALQDPFGQHILQRTRHMLETISTAGGSREDLTALFEHSISQLDASGTWRERMAVKTEAALNRLGNLRSRHYLIDAPNRVGMLRDILSVLADKHRIDMTALDSQLYTDASGSERVHFEIGIGDATVDFVQLQSDLTNIGVQLVAGQNSH